MGRGGGPFADREIESEVLHRGVQDLLDGPAQPMDLIDEEDVTPIEVGQNGCQISRPFDRRAGGDSEVDAHLMCQNVSQRRLAQSRWSVKQDVVERLAARLGGLNKDGQILLYSILADHFLQQARAQVIVVRIFRAYIR